MFSALKLRTFRIYWFGMVVSLIGTWIQQIAQSWLVFELTHSGFFLGLVGFFSFLPMFFFSLFGGVFADRFHKRNLLLITQFFFMILAFILAYLTSKGIIEVWHIIAISLLNGLVMAFDAPTRQSIVAELVGREHLSNAVALNTAAFHTTRIIGPAFAGILVGVIGMSGCFYLNGFSFLAVIAALLFIKIESRSANNNSSIKSDMIYALRYIWQDKFIKSLIYIISIPSLFGVWYVILMPIFAHDILGMDIKGLGILMSCNAFGAVLAALSLARLGDSKNKVKLLVFCSIFFSIFLCIFSFSKNVILSSLLLVALGYTSIMAVAIINTLLQLNVADQIRGRVMSIFMIAFAGLVPFGNLLAGIFTHFVGASLAVFFGGIICFGSLLILLLKENIISELKSKL